MTRNVLSEYLSEIARVRATRAGTGEMSDHVRDTARRLAAIRLLGPALDANYRAAAEAHVRPASPAPARGGSA